MPLDLPSFAGKVQRFREMFGESIDDLSRATGIAVGRVKEFEAATRAPTGDEILILADHFLCDFRFFISNEGAAPIERTEKLFRAHSKDLSTQDRRAIQEFLYLCESEAFLLSALGRPARFAFTAQKRGKYFKAHGQEAARALRASLGYTPKQVPDVFGDLRRLGVHVFRRRLESRVISGLFVAHPSAGPCVLVNYDEDFYRQRFTAAHEAAHAIFDQSDEYVVSFWKTDDLREVRANAFAGSYVVPAEVVAQLPDVPWSEDRVLDLADQLRVNVKTLTIALEREGRMSKEEANTFDRIRLPKHSKEDPELPPSMTTKALERKRATIERGLSSFYVDLCFEAQQRHIVSAARVAEMLQTDEGGLREIAESFGVRM